MIRYVRKELYTKLAKRIADNSWLIQAIVGPRQIGKTTLVLQLCAAMKEHSIYKTADAPVIPEEKWIDECWAEARNLLKNKKRVLLVIDEIHKIEKWSNAVKRNIDYDNKNGNKIKVIILGSSSLLMQKGLTESLAGRFELHKHHHWSYRECSECFGLSLKQYLYFGGYPKALTFYKDQGRWSAYVRDSIIANVLSGRDYKAATQDTEHWGHLVENAVGSVLYSLCKEKGAEIFYWRERDYEVDYIVKYGDKLIAIEVKSGKKIKDLSGLNIFKDRHEKAISLVISSTKEHIENHKIIDLEEYLLNPEIVFNIR